MNLERIGGRYLERCRGIVRCRSLGFAARSTRKIMSARRRGILGPPLEGAMITLLDLLPEDYVRRRLSHASGHELDGKFLSPDSSAALAVNAFAWFHTRPQLLPPLPGTEGAGWPATHVEVEYCARFRPPLKGPKPPPASQAPKEKPLGKSATYRGVSICPPA
jgi:hypothetical protein